MPIYEYKCDKCGSVFEELVRNEMEKPNCPECGSDRVSKRMSAPNAQSAADAPCGSDCGGERAHSCGCGCCHHHG